MAEHTEHLIGEVRYRVWRCASCGTVAKGAAVRQASNAVAAAGAPGGSSFYLRRQAQSGLSILPPREAPAPPARPWLDSAPPPREAAGRPSGEPPPPPDAGPA